MDEEYDGGVDYVEEPTDNAELIEEIPEEIPDTIPEDVSDDYIVDDEELSEDIPMEYIEDNADSEDSVQEELSSDVLDDIPEDLPEEIDEQSDEEALDLNAEASMEDNDELSETTEEQSETDTQDLSEEETATETPDNPETTEEQSETELQDVSEEETSTETLDNPETTEEQSETELQDVSEEETSTETLDNPETTEEQSETELQDVSEETATETSDNSETTEEQSETELQDVSEETATETSDNSETTEEQSETDTQDLSEEASTETLDNPETTEEQSETDTQDLGEENHNDSDSFVKSINDETLETEAVSAPEHSAKQPESYMQGVNSEIPDENVTVKAENIIEQPQEASQSVNIVSDKEPDNSINIPVNQLPNDLGGEMSTGELTDTSEPTQGSQEEAAMGGYSSVTPNEPHVDGPKEITNLADYMNSHNYGREDYATYSQDPEWRALMRKEYPEILLPPMSQESAKSRLMDYMSEHNYGRDDYATYSQDPVWRELQQSAYPEHEIPPIHDDSAVAQKISVSLSDSDVAGEDILLSKNPESGSDQPPKTEDVIEGELFGNFKTDKHINGSDSFVMGDHYEQYKKDYYTPGESTYESYDTPKVIDISPNAIEGIHISKWELEDPSVFWSQHENDGTIESFKEIASHIPEVREELASGKTVEELRNDPTLSECTRIYFENMPKVIKHDDYYEFDSNGRHRILAARELGYDIPVEVIGERSNNRDVSQQVTEKTDTEENSEENKQLGNDSDLQSAGEEKEVGAFIDKIKNFFSPSERTDVTTSTDDTPLKSVENDREERTPPTIEGLDIKEPEVDIAPLDETNQTTYIEEYDDGTKEQIFDHPYKMQKTLPYEQGNNNFNRKKLVHWQTWQCG